MNILKHHFYAGDTLSVSGALLGKKLVRKNSGHILSGLICETEAYLGSKDSASHAFKGKTPRNSVMFGRAGRAYVYFVYGMHYLLNVVTEEEENPCAILIRAIVPLDGIKQMQRYRFKSIGEYRKFITSRKDAKTPRKDKILFITISLCDLAALREGESVKRRNENGTRSTIRL